MMTKLFNDLNKLKDSPVGFKLTIETIARAAQLSQSIPALEQQWSLYLRALALLGFEQWLDDRAPDLRFRSDGVSLENPGYASFIDAACGLEVGKFSLCVIATSNSDLPIAVPKAAIELPEFAAQFYVLVELWEEEDWVRIWGGVSRDRLINEIETLEISANPDWTYSLPANCFELNPDDLLLEMRCLDPNAIPKPIVEPKPSLSSQLRTKLAAVKPQLQGGDREPWQIFSWDEAAMLLRDSDLIDELYDLEPIKPIKVPVAARSNSSPSVSPSTVDLDAGYELNRLLDWLKGVFSNEWNLLGSFPPAGGIVFCGPGDISPNIGQEIARLYASQPAKNASEGIVSPQMSNGDALAYLIQSVNDEGIRRQAVDLLQQIEPEHPILSAAREKDLSIYIEGLSIALRVLFIPRLDDRYSVLVRVYPTGDGRFLPEGLQLVVLNEEGNELVSHTARKQDDWMDRPLIVDTGDRFSIRIALNESSVTEAFVV